MKNITAKQYDTIILKEETTMNCSKTSYKLELENASQSTFYSLLFYSLHYFAENFQRSANYFP